MEAVNDEWAAACELALRFATWVGFNLIMVYRHDWVGTVAFFCALVVSYFMGSGYVVWNRCRRRHMEFH